MAGGLTSEYGRRSCILFLYGLPIAILRIEICMKLIFLCTLGLFSLIGCSPARRSPDAIRQDAAQATAEAARDAKAVAQGVVDGLRAKGPLNINRATAEELESLPGIDTSAANRIIAGRPYGNSTELVKRHLVTKAEYNRIANRVVAR
jgi:hypothetical protein